MLSLNGTQISIMGILNVTPDSFSGDGICRNVDVAVEHAVAMFNEGADIVDVGGESTRPGAGQVPVAEELARVIPVIEAIKLYTAAPVSIDTSKPEVMEAAVNAGASMINDVCALRRPGALEIAARLDVPICLMHMQGAPADMQRRPHYINVVQEVCEFLSRRVEATASAGVSHSNIMIDPGFGFGKSFNHNVQLLHGLPALVEEVGYPLVIGLSRKSFVRRLVGAAPTDIRLSAHGSAGLALFAASKGASMLRVHDVALTQSLIRKCQALPHCAEDTGKGRMPI
jgi:dihydropteroate synthase